jgi:hypothetical protein
MRGMARYLPCFAALVFATGCQPQVAGQGSAATIVPSDMGALLRPVGEQAAEAPNVALNAQGPGLEQPARLIVSDR